MMPSSLLTGAHTLTLPAVSAGGRRRVTHVTPRLLGALAPHVRAGCPAEHNAALASLLALVTDVDAEDQGGAAIDCATVPALGERIRLHPLAGGGLLAAFADESALAPT
ncbi:MULTISPECIES: hypothetical protein [Streptomyces]|uniref:hypothetical protein n=1 Tax=Streptomyces TaxID=1883 RepID=UPI00163C87ED|nr:MULTISPECIES: hypothetical protein [Streptomyces]MBC2879811.1 hypothetical protein [Streptomyces sp. TYQ1024]UBI41417.1 hypothetical protein K7I03_33675 [Streptomyces mobaraensis]